MAVQNPTALSTLRANIPPSMKGPVWDALLGALGDQQQVSWDCAQSVYDQLFLISAEGQYLAQRASEIGGYVNPDAVSFSDDAFRRLVIQLSTRKLTLPAFLGLLELYYGIDSTRASIRTTIAEPFNIPDGSKQIFTIDGLGPFVVNLKAIQFQNSTAVTAIEASIALNQGFALIGAKALALPFEDSVSGLTYLTVYAASQGIRGSIEYVSGPLSFPLGKVVLPQGGRAAYVAPDSSIVFPATSPVVVRTPGVNCANILDAVPVDIVSAEFFDFDSTSSTWGSDSFWGNSALWGSVTANTVLITTATYHGLQPGRWVYVDGLQTGTDFSVPFKPNGLFPVSLVPSTTSFVVVFDVAGVPVI